MSSTPPDALRLMVLPPDGELAGVLRSVTTLVTSEAEASVLVFDARVLEGQPPADRGVLVVCDPQDEAAWLGQATDVCSTPDAVVLVARARNIVAAQQAFNPGMALFLRQVVHDLRNPLNAIDMLMSMVSEALPLDEDAELEEDHEAILEAVDMMSWQLSHLRDLGLAPTMPVWDGPEGSVSVDIGRIIRACTARRAVAGSVACDLSERLTCLGPVPVVTALVHDLIANALAVCRPKHEVLFHGMRVEDACMLVLQVPTRPLPEDMPHRLRSVEGAMSLREQQIKVHPGGLAVSEAACRRLDASLTVRVLPGGDLQFRVDLPAG